MTNHDSYTETLSTKLPIRMYRAIQAIALAHDTSVSNIVRQAIGEFVSRERRIYEELARVYAEYPETKDER